MVSFGCVLSVGMVSSLIASLGSIPIIGIIFSVPFLVKPLDSLKIHRVRLSGGDRSVALTLYQRHCNLLYKTSLHTSTFR